MNDLQQLALLSVTSWQDKQALEAEWRNFKYAAIAAHPENTESILKALEGALAADEENPEEWAEPISDEELGQYRPYGEDAEQVIAELRSQGFSVRD